MHKQSLNKLSPIGSKLIAFDINHIGIREEGNERTYQNMQDSKSLLSPKHCQTLYSFLRFDCTKEILALLEN